jgi:cell fate regulator YaaT (PSP1 superfamily)
VVASQRQEYLVSHGASGEFGRFYTVLPLTCVRGEEVVVQGRRGLELGVVLCEATPIHARLLDAVPTGELVRLASAEDRLAASSARERGHGIFDDCRALAANLGLPLEVLDVDLSLDGRQAVVQFLGAEACDVDVFAATLARRHDLFVLMHNLAQSAEEEEEGGCGEPNCGRANGGSCTTCASGGGCATGCGTAKPDMADYFAHLRAKMEKRDLKPLL